MTKEKICCVFNYAPHYRKSIYSLIDSRFDCSFYFGDKLSTSTIKKIDYSVFSKYPVELKRKNLWGNFYLLSGFVRLSFHSSKIYLITGEYYCISSWIFLILTKLMNKKVYLWGHGAYGNEGWLKRSLKRIYGCLSTGFLLYGDYAKEIMINQGIPEKKLNVIYNSLDYSIQLSRRKVLPNSSVYKDYFKNDYPVLIFIGRLSKVKKLDMIISAMQILYKDGFYVNAVIIGSGPEKDTLEQQVFVSGLDSHIWFYGPCYDEEILGNLIFNADLCVSPGNVGLTAIHSLGNGTPVITHGNKNNQMPEFEAIVDGVTGSFFEENNVSSLSSAIYKWLNKYPSKSSEIVQQCYRVIDEKYNPFVQIKIIEELIKNESITN